MSCVFFSPSESIAVRESFGRLAPNADAFVASLYGHLFRLAPGVRALFADLMDEQHYKLIRMLTVMVETVDDPDTFERECRESGERHRQYGAKPGHYAVLREAFAAALTDVAAPGPEEVALWLRLYDESTRLMTDEG